MDDLLLVESKKIWTKSRKDTETLDIIYKNEKIGEIEYDKNSDLVGKKMFEIVSIYIDKPYRKLKLGKESVYKIFDYFDIEEICLMSAKTALKFWKSFDPKKFRKDIFIISH
jgi:hypothetical protein